MAERLEPRVLLSSELVKDINATTAGSGPNGFTPSGDWLCFSANDTVHGQELWKTDGTEAGTSLVADLAPGTQNSNPGGLTDVNGRLFFVADNRLWVTDGTAAGTLELATLNIEPASMTAVGNRLFFSAQDSEHGSELWTSDGTPAGTHLVKDIKPGASSSGPADRISYGGLLAFRADGRGAGPSLHWIARRRECRCAWPCDHLGASGLVTIRGKSWISQDTVRKMQSLRRHRAHSVSW